MENCKDKKEEEISSEDCVYLLLRTSVQWEEPQELKRPYFATYNIGNKKKVWKITHSLLD